MTLAQHGALLGLWVAGIVVPGPDVFLVLRNAFLSSRRNAVFTALGVMAGNTVWITLSLLGVTVLVSGNPVLRLVVQTAGALFLLRMGIGAVRGGMASRAGAGREGLPGGAGPAAGEPASEEPGAPRTAVAPPGGGARFLGAADLTPWRALVQGTVTNLANAKAMVFFVALFGSVLPSGMPWWDALEVMGLLLAVGVAWFCAVAWVGSVPALARRFSARSAEVEIGSGVLFLLVAAGLLVEVLATA